MDMDDHPEDLSIEELTSLGLYDPAAPDAADRLELLRHVRSLGATTEQIAASRSLGDLSLDLSLRHGPWFELAQVVASSGLEWDDACLSFHQTSRPVRTASASQVRQPIYRSSVQRWRPEPYLLQPLLAGLGISG